MGISPRMLLVDSDSGTLLLIYRNLENGRKTLN